jgi:hypothetical protein
MSVAKCGAIIKVLICFGAKFERVLILCQNTLGVKYNDLLSENCTFQTTQKIFLTQIINH